MRSKGKKADHWRIPQEYLNKLDKYDSEFLLAHAEKRLSDSLDTNKIIVDKSTTFLTLSLSLVAALLGYYMDKLGNNKPFDAIQETSLIGAAYLFIVAVLFSINLFNWKYGVPGAKPRGFFNADLFKENMTCDDRVVCIIANEIAEYQKRIEKNEKTNKWRWKLFRSSYIGLVMSPLLLGAVYLLVR